VLCGGVGAARSVIYLTLPELLRVTERAISGEVVIRDYGLLESALGRSQATVFGRDAYPTLDLKAVALLHSLARNHALADGTSGWRSRRS
jgi:death on curing protein